MNTKIYKTPIGNISMTEDGNAITSVDFVEDRNATTCVDSIEYENATTCVDSIEYENATTCVDSIEYENATTCVEFVEDGCESTSVETPILAWAYKELMEYMNGNRQEFTVPLNPSGTPFQKKVWEVLRSIPYGETLSYKEVAEKAGNSKACRAVGMANNKNPIPIMIPCHRVIGSNGKLVGYGGGLPIKIRLLNIEKCYFINEYEIT
ncbi:MAG: methylated-DNA--[protein]-cysteine S-methyltransferase [Anaerocolumna sp.]